MAPHQNDTISVDPSIDSTTPIRGTERTEPCDEHNFQPDDAATHCPLCEDEFTLTKRRHHCRWCGGLACAKCTESKHRLQDDSSSKQRVCKDCEPAATEYEAHLGEPNSEHDGRPHSPNSDTTSQPHFSPRDDLVGTNKKEQQPQPPQEMSKKPASEPVKNRNWSDAQSNLTDQASPVTGKQNESAALRNKSPLVAVQPALSDQLDEKSSKDADKDSIDMKSEGVQVSTKRLAADAKKDAGEEKVASKKNLPPLVPSKSADKAKKDDFKDADKAKKDDFKHDKIDSDTLKSNKDHQKTEDAKILQSKKDETFAKLDSDALKSKKKTEAAKEDSSSSLPATAAVAGKAEYNGKSASGASRNLTSTSLAQKNRDFKEKADEAHDEACDLANEVSAGIGKDLKAFGFVCGAALLLFALSGWWTNVVGAVWGVLSLRHIRQQRSLRDAADEVKHEKIGTGFADRFLHASVCLGLLIVAFTLTNLKTIQRFGLFGIPLVAAPVVGLSFFIGLYPALAIFALVLTLNGAARLRKELRFIREKQE